MDIEEEDFRRLGTLTEAQMWEQHVPLAQGEYERLPPSFAALMPTSPS
jgi:hypothetical protein